MGGDDVGSVRVEQRNALSDRTRNRLVLSFARQARIWSLVSAVLGARVRGHDTSLRWLTAC